MVAVNLTNGNIHTMVSTTPTLIYLAAGAAKVEELQPVLEVRSLVARDLTSQRLVNSKFVNGYVIFLCRMSLFCMHLLWHLPVLK